MNKKLNIDELLCLIGELSVRCELGGMIVRLDVVNDFAGDVCVYDILDVPLMRLNWRCIKNYSKGTLVKIILHEIGHVKTKYQKIKSKVVCEYKAERYALDIIKKWYPQYYNSQIRVGREEINDKVWCKRYPTHAKAYKTIEEYNV